MFRILWPLNEGAIEWNSIVWIDMDSQFRIQANLTSPLLFFEPDKGISKIVIVVINVYKKTLWILNNNNIIIFLSFTVSITIKLNIFLISIIQLLFPMMLITVYLYFKSYSFVKIVYYKARVPLQEAQVFLFIV